jgi:hypothetical protein
VLKLFPAAILVLCLSANGNYTCSDFGTPNDCAELGCDWSDRTQTCSDQPIQSTEAAMQCESIKSVELCESRPDCAWNWTQCEEG